MSENNPGGPKIWLRGIVKIGQCRGQGHTLWRWGEAWGSRPLVAEPLLRDVSLIFDIHHKTESAVQSSWMNARVSAELLSGVGAGGGEAHGTGDSGGLDVVRSSAKVDLEGANKSSRVYTRDARAAVCRRH